jgi:lipoyl(octanoyl) transferase
MLNPCTSLNKISLNEIVKIKNLGHQEYYPVWQQMKLYTHNRTIHSDDEIWNLEHFPVYTQGQAGKAEHILDPGLIPVLQSDRGGQVTYHGPGQVVLYCLVDIARKNIGVRDFVCTLENSVIELLATYDIIGSTDRSAPGVYVSKSKICSLGLRVRHGRTYHGLSLNVNMDLEPFGRINPCGYAGMSVTHMQEFVPTAKTDIIAQQLITILINKIGYRGITS